MLELRPNCEACGRALPPDSTEAMICSFECTFCRHCVDSLLHNVCPNCGGGLNRRPIRPRARLIRHPASTREVRRTVDEEAHAALVAKFKDVPPEHR